MRINHGHTVMLAANILFGVNYALSKDIMGIHVTPLSLNAFRFAAGMTGFWILSVFKPEKVPLKDLGILFAGSMLGLLSNQIFFIQGLSRTSPLDASIIATSVPLITMVLSAIFLREPISWMKVLGVFTGATGAVFLVLSSQSDVSGQSSVLGDLLCFASCLTFAGFLIVTKKIAQRYSPITIMKWMFLFATVIYTPFSLKSALSTNFEAFDGQATFSFLFILIGATILPYLMIPVGQKLLRPTTLAMYNYVQPLVAAVLATILGQGTYTWSKGLAAILIFSGVYFVTRSKSRSDIEMAKLKKD